MAANDDLERHLLSTLERLASLRLIAEEQRSLVAELGPIESEPGTDAESVNLRRQVREQWAYAEANYEAAVRSRLNLERQLEGSA